VAGRIICRTSWWLWSQRGKLGGRALKYTFQNLGEMWARDGAHPIVRSKGKQCDPRLVYREDANNHRVLLEKKRKNRRAIRPFLGGMLSSPLPRGGKVFEEPPGRPSAQEISSEA